MASQRARALVGAAEEPIVPSQDNGPHRSLDMVIDDAYRAVVQESLQGCLLTQGISDRLSQQRLGGPERSTGADWPWRNSSRAVLSIPSSVVCASILILQNLRISASGTAARASQASSAHTSFRLAGALMELNLRIARRRDLGGTARMAEREEQIDVVVRLPRILPTTEKICRCPARRAVPHTRTRHSATRSSSVDPDSESAERSRDAARCRWARARIGCGASWNPAERASLGPGLAIRKTHARHETPVQPTANGMQNVPKKATMGATFSFRGDLYPDH